MTVWVVLKGWLADRRLVIGAWLACVCVTGLFFWLYALPGETFLTLLLFEVLCSAGFALVDWIRYFRKYWTLLHLKEEILVTAEHLPQENSLLEGAYLDLLHLLSRENRRIRDKSERELSDMVEYYTMWVHQIKTPIAAMGLLLQTEPDGRNSAMEMELMKISQYVEMVLQYLRLDSETSDFVLRPCALNEVIRQTLRKYAKLFILKRIRLNFQETEAVVLSDEKWLAFLLEQLLSNALKYTPSGGTIALHMEPNEVLVISDTGIGIAPEDLPRVFEKGYTGGNGRSDKKATGIGLYLCRRVADLLGHSLTLSSRLGEGTQVRMGFSRRELPIE